MAYYGEDVEAMDPMKDPEQASMVSHSCRGRVFAEAYRSISRSNEWCQAALIALLIQPR